MKNKGFTLLELLIVIALIGLLSSIILVSFQDAKERANIAKGLYFSGQVNHYLGYWAVGIWDFNEIKEGNKVYDSSGNNNHGTIYGATLVKSIPELGNALSFDGVNDYVNAGQDTSLKVNDKSFTLEAWIKPAADIPTGGRYTVMAFYNPGWLMDLPDDSNIDGYRFHNGSSAYKYNAPGGSISLEWTHFLVVRNLTTNKLMIYLNGQLKQTWNITTVTASNNPLLIGKRSDGFYFNGLIDEVHIYKEALTSAQIQKLYTEGVKRHGIALME